MQQTFEAKLDDLTKIVTYVIFAVLVVPLVLLINMALHGNPEVLIPMIFVLITLGVASLFRVKEYVLTPEALQVIQKSGTKKFSRDDFTTATPVTTKDLGFGIRLFGSSGFLGYFGTFYYRNVGKTNLFATDRKKLILLRRKKGSPIVISPADAESFLKALNLPTEPLPIT